MPSAAKITDIAEVLHIYIGIDAPPKHATEVISDILVGENWCTTRTEAVDQAECMLPRVLKRLRDDRKRLAGLGRMVPIVVNSADDHLLQGAGFIEPQDSQPLREEKRALCNASLYVSAFTELSPRQFEALCVGFTRLMGVVDPVLTPSSRDEGIDFYGKLGLSPLLRPASTLPGFDCQLAVWVIGQAKHHRLGHVSTPEIRDLVGAVNLAKGKAFGTGGPDKYKDMTLRVCDPVVYLFLTTGEISGDGWRLLDGSGVIGLDGHMLAAFLAERRVATASTGAFDKGTLLDWINKNLLQT